jgi:hypothetical protein
VKLTEKKPIVPTDEYKDAFGEGMTLHQVVSSLVNAKWVVKTTDKNTANAQEVFVRFWVPYSWFQHSQDVSLKLTGIGNIEVAEYADFPDKDELVWVGANFSSPYTGVSQSSPIEDLSVLKQWIETFEAAGKKMLGQEKSSEPSIGEPEIQITSKSIQLIPDNPDVVGHRVSYVWPGKCGLDGLAQVLAGGGSGFSVWWPSVKYTTKFQVHGMFKHLSKQYDVVAIYKIGGDLGPVINPLIHAGFVKGGAYTLSSSIMDKFFGPKKAEKEEVKLEDIEPILEKRGWKLFSSFTSPVISKNKYNHSGMTGDLIVLILYDGPSGVVTSVELLIDDEVYSTPWSLEKSSIDSWLMNISKEYDVGDAPEESVQESQLVEKKPIVPTDEYSAEFGEEKPFKKFFADQTGELLVYASLKYDDPDNIWQLLKSAGWLFTSATSTEIDFKKPGIPDSYIVVGREKDGLKVNYVGLHVHGYETVPSKSYLTLNQWLDEVEEDYL